MQRFPMITDRRGFLTVGALAGVGLTLSDYFRVRAEQKHYDFIEARADSVIHIFLPGGMAHQESFDPKPYAPVEYRGSLGMCQTKLPGSIGGSAAATGAGAYAHASATANTHVVLSQVVVNCLSVMSRRLVQAQVHSKIPVICGCGCTHPRPVVGEGYLMWGPMCAVDFSFSLQMNSKSSVLSIRRALVVTVHGFV